MKKLFGYGDIKVILDNPNTKGRYVPPIEVRQVLEHVRDVTYVLYSIYRTFPFKEASEIEDEAIAKHLGWLPRKVRDHRLLLEKANMFRTVRYGTKTEGVTKVFVGMDVVALFDAGLPAQVLEPKILNKLKKEFSITSPQELMHKAPMIVAAYTQEPDKYE